ncbi:MAG: PhzF family phenazine biosynthesis protein [Eubacteriales bacterium]
MKHAHLKAFTYKGRGGNSAGVVLIKDNLTDKQMQKKATEVGFSETAFVKKINGNKFNIRFFTPKCEVDLCGHATIASFYYLAINNLIEPHDGKWSGLQTTKAGNLNVEVNYINNKIDMVCMQQNQPEEYGEVLDFKDIALSLNTSEDSIGLEDYKINPRIISTGLKDILIPIKSREILNNIKPDFEKITHISLLNQAVGFHLYTLDEGKIYTRNFAPGVGINEECATGTSNGALIYLLSIEGITDEADIIQGEAMGETSMIYSKVVHLMNKYIIKVGGKATLINER